MQLRITPAYTPAARVLVISLEVQAARGKARKAGGEGENKADRRAKTEVKKPDKTNPTRATSENDHTTNQQQIKDKVRGTVVQRLEIVFE